MSTFGTETNSAVEILKNTGVEVHADEFTILSVTKTEWSKLLQDNALSPSGRSPFLIFSEDREVTLVLNAADFDNIRHAIDGSRFERGFRLLTFTSAMEFTVVGFLAEVSRILAEAGVPIVALSSYSRDHLLVKQTDLATALKALGPHVDEIC